MWEKYKRGKPVAALPLPQPALAPPGPFQAPSPRPGQGRKVTLKEIVERTTIRPRGGMTIAEREQHYRAPARVAVPGREKGNILLRHIFGEGPPEKPPRGPVVARPPRPKPILTQRAAMPPKPQPVRPRGVIQALLAKVKSFFR
jgi:hypothetical protein